MNIRRIAGFITATALVAGTASAEVKVATKGGLKVSSGDYSVAFGGRIHYDYNRSERNGQVRENAFDARRARVFMKGNVGNDWGYKINWNVDGSGFEDLYIQYKGWGKAKTLKIGKQLAPFTLSQNISSKDGGISERPAILERYTLGRQEGAMLSGDVGNMHYGVMVFSEDRDRNGSAANTSEDITRESSAYAGRVTFAPVKSATQLVHVGASYKSTADQDGYGIELGAVSGPFHMQAEYFDAEEGAMDISGQYIQVGYVITGEVRPYKKGTFKRLKPSRETGAWEVVMRYEDGDGNFSDMELGGTDASAYGFGINYYANNAIRINTSYEKAESNINDDEGEEFRVRFQMAL